MKALAQSSFLVLALMAGSHGCETADLIANWNSTGIPPLILGRPAMQHDWLTPDGRFYIHYDVSGPRSVFHPSEDTQPMDGIPDYVNRAADYLSLAYDSLVTGIGFDPPPFDGFEGGDSLYDVYLTEVTGLTTPEYPSQQYPGRLAYSSYMQLGHDLRSINYPTDPLPLLKVLAAHEYFHAVQFAYRAYSSDLTPWWFESCAMWAEEKVFDNVNDVYYYLDHYLSQPYRSLYLTNGQFIYGAWLLPQYLENRFGESFLKESWEYFIGFNIALEALNYALLNRGMDLNDELCTHQIWNYFTGENYSPGFYSEAEQFPTTVYEARTHFNYPVEWLDEPNPLENVASSYIVFGRNSMTKGTLVIDYLNSTEHRHKVCIVIAHLNSGVEYQIYEIDSGIRSTFTVTDFNRFEKVIMIPVWIYEGAPNGDASSYRYQARLDTLTTPISSDIFPEGRFELIGAYPNPFNSSVSVSFRAPREGPSKFTIFDITGRSLFEMEFEAEAGGNQIIWNAPEGLATGVLFYRINLDSQQANGKIVYLK